MISRLALPLGIAILILNKAGENHIGKTSTEDLELTLMEKYHTDFTRREVPHHRDIIGDLVLTSLGRPTPH